LCQRDRRRTSARTDAESHVPVKLRPYWWDTVPGAFATRPVSEPPPSLPHRSDVVIVGGGYTGLAAARRLGRSGASVLVVDREPIGWGASSRNGGQVLAGLRLDAATLIARYGEARAIRLFAAGNDAIAHLAALIAEEQIECEFARTGHLMAAAKPSHFTGFVEERDLLARTFHHPVELVGRSEQRTELGTDRYHGLLIDESSAGVNPAKYADGLAKAAVRAGARLVPGVAVERIERSGSGWRVHTSIGSVDAENVLLATNGYTDRAAPELQRRLIPIGSYVIATEPLAHDQAAAILPHRRMAFDSKNFLFYFRLTADGRLLFGGRAEFSKAGPDAVARAADILASGMRRVFPQVAGVAIDYAWGGNVAFTRDEMPHAGVLDGLFFSGGYCGHGIAIATEMGDAIARRIAGDTSAHPLLEEPCPAIPFYHGNPWFLPLAGAYYRFKDWIA